MHYPPKHEIITGTTECIISRSLEIYCLIPVAESVIHRSANCPKSSGQLEKFLYDTIKGCIDNAESLNFPNRQK